MNNPGDKGPVRVTKAEKAAALYRKGLALYEGDGVKKDEFRGAQMIAEAAELGDPEAKDWIDDYGFDDNAQVQGEA